MQSKTVVVVGGAGALGSNIISTFKRGGVPHVASIDYKSNPEADENIIITSANDNVPLSTTKADVVICVAGSWQGTADPFTYKDTLSTWTALEASNIKPTLLAATLASAHGARLVLASAAAARHACPGMVEYGMVKSAVNMLARSVQLERGTLVLCPAVLDTPANRMAMPSADTSKWTPLADISAFLLEDSSKEHAAKECRFVTIKTSGGKSSFEDEPL